MGMAKPLTHSRTAVDAGPSPARSWGPDYPSPPGRGQVWPPEPMAALAGAPDPLLEALKKRTRLDWTGDSGGQVNLGDRPRGSPTGLKGHRHSVRKLEARDKVHTLEVTREGGKRLSSAAAAVLRVTGPTPHHFGGPESAQRRLLGLLRKGAG